MKEIIMLFFVYILFFITLLITYPSFIKLMKKKQYGQYIRQEGPDLHNYKQGTPTFGGILFVSAIFLMFIITYFVKKDPIYMISGISGILFGFTGFLDDFISVRKKHSTGFNSLQKLIVQIIFSVIIFLLINFYNPHSFINIPFGSGKIELGWFYPVWAVLFISGLSNATNLTDGLDGLSSGTFVVSALFTVLVTGKNYDIIFILTLPVLAFMMYNIKPAKIFMGDTGSLSFGAILAAIALYNSSEFLTVFTCFIFICELFSVIIQVSSFKLRNKRVFRMAPIHHHFELLGWSEERVVMNFWIINLIAGIITFGGFIL